MKESNSHELNKGIAKVKANERIFNSKDNISDTRKVRINSNTWVLTKCETDEQAIAKFNKAHGL